MLKYKVGVGGLGFGDWRWEFGVRRSKKMFKKMECSGNCIIWFSWHAVRFVTAPKRAHTHRHNHSTIHHNMTSYISFFHSFYTLHP